MANRFYNELHEKYPQLSGMWFELEKYLTDLYEELLQSDDPKQILSDKLLLIYEDEIDELDKYILSNRETNRQYRSRQEILLEKKYSLKVTPHKISNSNNHE